MSSAAPRPAASRVPALAVGLWALLVGMNAAVLALALWGLRESRRVLVVQAGVNAQNLAQVLEQDLGGRFRQVDLVLESVQDAARSLPKGLADPALARLLPRFQRRMPVRGDIWCLDASGALRQGTPTDPAVRQALADTFHALAQHPQDGLQLALPGTAGAPRLLLGQAVLDAQGTFTGAIVAGLPLSQLTSLLGHVDVGPHGTVSLRAGNLALLARYPSLGGAAPGGSSRLSGDLRAAVEARSPRALFTTASVLDGERRTYAFRRLDHPSCYVLVGLAERDYLHAWGHQAAALGLALVIILGLSLAIAWMARATWLRQRASLARLAEEEARYRLLAENALDVVWTLDLDGNLAYVSPAIERQRGWTPEVFMALDPSLRALGGTHNGHIQGILAAARTLSPGTQPPGATRWTEATVACRDGRQIQVEARWRVVWGPDGRMLGIQGATRDITERKRMEAEREQLIQDLTRALAEVKALSGLLPICSRCKKVRDDQGYWQQIEAYLSEHTEATFTHGLCPDCARVFREEIQARRSPPPGEGEGP